MMWRFDPPRPALLWICLAGVALSSLPQAFSQPQGFAAASCGGCEFHIDNATLFRRGPTCAPQECLGSLNFQSHQIAQVNGGTFEGLTSLESIDLSWNMISAFSGNEFAGLSGLKELNLNHNQLTGLPATIFRGLTALRSLSFNHNQIETLPSGLFTGLTSLEDLRFANNAIVGQLPYMIFSDMKNIARIELNNNFMNDLPTSAFAGLSKLQHIQLAGNRFPALTTTQFDDQAASLTELTLDDFAYISIWDNTLTRLQNLRRLTLNGTLDSKRYSYMFAAPVLSGLTHLNMYGYSIEELPQNIFNGLVSLQELQLSNNAFTSINFGVFQGLPNLQGLYLANNSISYIHEDAFQNLSTLRTLWLDHNMISYIPDGLFHGLYGLSGLTLNSNELTSIPDGMFRDLDSLDYLGLAYNRISAISPSAFPLNLRQNLHGLNLGGNQITEILPYTFYYMNNIQYLSLENNQISSIADNAFQGLASVQYLYLFGNKLTTLSGGMFQGLWNVRFIGLSWNPVSHVSNDIMSYLPSTVYFAVDGFQLQCCPSSWKESYNHAYMCGSMSVCATEMPAGNNTSGGSHDFRHPLCQEARTWEDIARIYKISPQMFTTGGLGPSAAGPYKTWACFESHPCVFVVSPSTPAESMCYLYDEELHSWHPWGLKSGVSFCGSSRPGSGR